MRLALALAFASLIPCSAWASRASLADKRGDGHHAKKESRKEGKDRHVKALPGIEMQHLSTHESFTLRPDANGGFGKKQLRALKHFLRCHHTGREHAMSPRLAQLLYATARHFDDRPITVIAGYRAPKIARKKGNPKSPHKKGIACDFRIDGVENTTLRDYLRETYKGVGVGYYPNAGFIHLDARGGKSAFWIDYSGPGERAEYSRDPDGDLVSGAVMARTRGVSAQPGDPDITGDEDDDTALSFADDPGTVDLVAPALPSAPPHAAAGESVDRGPGVAPGSN